MASEWLVRCLHGIRHGIGSGLGEQVKGLRHFEGSILFANHKANGVVTNIGLLANTVDDTGSYMAG